MAVTGETAYNIDFFDTANGAVAYVFPFVLGVSFLLLMVVFRSIVVPLKAILLNLLSVGATYGILVLTFQKGWGESLGLFTQYPIIEAWIPLFLVSGAVRAFDGLSRLPSQPNRRALRQDGG